MAEKILSLTQATDLIFKHINGEIRLATPLGLGKPNQLLNLIYQKAKDDERALKIYTALSLDLPSANEDLAKRFLDPFLHTQFGSDYPRLKYSLDAKKDQVPDHIEVREFYFQAGSALKSTHLQRHYQSINYTHVAQEIYKSNVNVIVQMVAKKDNRLSLACNPDLTLDVFDFYKNSGKPVFKVAVIHPDLFFLSGEAEVSMGEFDLVVESNEVTHHLFALPRMPIPIEDHLIGFYGSQLVRDGGTLQVGIGSLSEALTHSLILRHQKPDTFQKLIKSTRPVPDSQTEVFNRGLYGLTEMLTDGFMHLRKAGILKRTIKDEISKKETFLHGSFILGSKPLYSWLKNLSPEEQSGLRMTRVSKVNDLFDPNESALRKQRTDARFFNTTMQVSLMGEAMSETLPDSKVISGVGGQYNFVAMALELKDALSIIMLRSTRFDQRGKKVSNIVWHPGHVTIPRHLRDIVITEYGVARLRGKSDEECIKALLNITDSQFQEDLLKLAKKAKKVRADYQIPERFKNNTSENLISSEHFPEFPFGSDFTQEEENLARALAKIQQDQKISKFKLIKRALFSTKPKNKFIKELDRMKLSDPKSLKEKFYQRLLLSHLG